VRDAVDALIRFAALSRRNDLEISIRQRAGRLVDALEGKAAGPAPVTPATPELRTAVPVESIRFQAEIRSPAARVSWWRRWILLYAARSAGGWVVRIVFYFCALIAFSGGMAYVSGEPWNSTDSTIFGIMAALTLIFRCVASRIDRRDFRR
jgi:hypothetical protein